ncbi:MAG TPA: glycosyltransferase family 2 protein [Candidatus Omnitrophota bacterium]|nr:glycosyltransferase family 2 protein [Candidatus Omnitrophota bacterium]
MNDQVDLTLILPAYNEVKSIGQTLAEARAYLDRQGLTYEIIVSADGTDGTRELVGDLAATDSRLRVIGSPERKGKGHGVRQAVFLAKGEIIGFVDADNKTPVTELKKVLPCFGQGYDIVIGSRGLKTAQIIQRQPFYRRLGAFGFRLFMWGVTGLWSICDTQCGFKFFKRDVALDLFQRQKIDGYMFDVEILYLAQQANYRLKQVGVAWKDDGDSRLVLVGGNIRNFLDVLKIRF